MDLYIYIGQCPYWPGYPDTAIVSPVSNMTSGSTAFARSLTLKFLFLLPAIISRSNAWLLLIFMVCEKKVKFQCSLILYSDSVIILYLRLPKIHWLRGTQGLQTLAFELRLRMSSAFLTGLSRVASPNHTCCVLLPGRGWGAALGTGAAAHSEHRFPAPSSKLCQI